MSEPDYAQWVALREYLRNAAFEMRGDVQVSDWVKAWTRQIDDKLTISGQSYRVCPTCDRGGHTCPGCGNDIRHGQSDCGEHSEPRRTSPEMPHVTSRIVFPEALGRSMTRAQVLDEELAKVEISIEPGANPVGALIAVNERVDQRMSAEREVPVSQLVSGDSVYSPSTKTWHEVRRATSGQLYFQRDGAWKPVDFAADVKFLARRGDAGAAADRLFMAFGGEVIEDA
jgi:hypothetical protein